MNSKHLNIVQIAPETERKTKVFRVISSFDNTCLGTISWYPRWRQYVFNPNENCVWSHDCLSDLSEYIKDLMNDRKKHIGNKNE
jgi:hypothetical protein